MDQSKLMEGITMSVLLGTATDHGDGRLSTLALRLLEFLHSRIARYQAIQELDALSDRYLRDIGVERLDIPRLIDAEMSRTSGSSPRR